MLRLRCDAHRVVGTVQTPVSEPPVLRVVPDATPIRPADDIVQSLRRLADELEALEEKPAYVTVIISALNVDRFYRLRHYGAEYRSAASAEQCAFNLLYAQKLLADMADFGDGDTGGESA